MAYFILGNQQGSPLIADVQDQETILKQCIQQLETVEATRAALVDQLKEALKEQVTFVFIKLEHLDSPNIILMLHKLFSYNMFRNQNWNLFELSYK